jgi:hypothetical protein
MTRRVHLLLAWLFAIAALSPAGCDHSPAEARRDPPKVTVTPAVEREVLDSLEFQGRTEAVEVRSRTRAIRERGTEVVPAVPGR